MAYTVPVRPVKDIVDELYMETGGAAQVCNFYRHFHNQISAALSGGLSPATIRRSVGPAFLDQSTSEFPGKCILPLPLRDALVENLRLSAEVLRQSLSLALAASAEGYLDYACTLVDVDLWEGLREAWSLGLKPVVDAGRRHGWRLNQPISVESTELRNTSWPEAVKKWRACSANYREISAAVREARARCGSALVLLNSPLNEIGPTLGRGERYGYAFSGWKSLAPRPFAFGDEVRPAMASTYNERLSSLDTWTASMDIALRRTRACLASSRSS
ncbi:MULTISPECIES: hypothetical protein [Mycobacteroides]|uniref:hypothetical protein n=1 Tax=Mycobacteroides TaxID=670516 RepID=UPI000ABABA0A|nr:MULTISPECIES: hypothetical protein [Mycobacteroides]